MTSPLNHAPPSILSQPWKFSRKDKINYWTLFDKRCFLQWSFLLLLFLQRVGNNLCKYFLKCPRRICLGFQVRHYSDDYYYENYDQEYGDATEEVDIEYDIFRNILANIDFWLRQELNESQSASVRSKFVLSSQSSSFGLT